MKFLLNDKKIETGQSFDYIKSLMNDYDFKTTILEHSSDIIFHGKCQFETLHQNVVMHMYFNQNTKKIKNIVIHPLPINFNSIQAFLEEQFGIPNVISSKKDIKWILEDGEVFHIITDRFGEEEMIYLTFDIQS